MKFNTKILSLFAATGFLLNSGSAVYASTSTISDADLLTFCQATVPYASRLTSDPIWPTGIDGTALTDMDGAKIGTATVTANTQPAFYLDGSNNLRANAYFGGSLRTYKCTGLAASWSATGTVTLAEDIRDGVSGPGSAGSLAITLTKTGSVADLSRDTFVAFLRGTATRALSTLTGTGTTLAPLNTAPLTTGWAATAVFKDNAAAAVAGTLDAIESGFTLPVTLGSSVSTYTTLLKNFDLWNVANASTNKVTALFTTTGGTLKFEVKPAKLTTRTTTGLAANVLAELVKLGGRMINAKASLIGFYPKLTEIAPTLASRYAATGGASLYDKMSDDSVVKAGVAALVVADFTTTADTNKYGLAALDGSSITSVTWDTDGPKVIATGKVGSADPEDFVCDLTSKTVVKSGTNDIMLFKSLSGRSFIVKAFDSTGVDTSAVTTFGVGAQDDLLAFSILASLSSTATITAKAVDALHH